MKIRMLTSISGTFHGISAGVKHGDVVDVDEFSALRYLKAGYAHPVKDEAKPVVETAVVPVEDVETAKLDAPAEVDDKPQPLDEPKRGPGRPRHNPDQGQRR